MSNHIKAHSVRKSFSLSKVGRAVHGFRKKLVGNRDLKQKADMLVAYSRFDFHTRMPAQACPQLDWGFDIRQRPHGSVWPVLPEPSVWVYM